MKAGEVKLNALLVSNSQYQVPLFQRTYNWGKDEWDQIWEDIGDIYMMPDRRSHFIGAVVTQKLDAVAGRATPYLLIDGQQRLTTLLTILAAIRAKALEAPNQWSGISEQIENTCLTNKIFDAPREEFFKLRPTQRDREPFEAVMRNNIPAERRDSNVFAAFQYFMEALANGDREGDPFNLNELKLCITEYLELVSVTLDQHDSPHKIFESLNNTGMDLGASDLIRNYLFMHIKDQERANDVYELDWYPMQGSTGKHLDDFFWRYLMMDGSLPRVDETFGEIKRQLGNLSEDSAVASMKRFANFAWHYRRLRQTERGIPAFNEQAARLNTWEVSVAYPFLMKALEWTEEGDITWDMLIDSMEMIESYVIRRAVCGLATNRLRSFFARMAGQAQPGNFVEQTRDYLVKSDWPVDEWFRKEFVTYQLYYASRLDRTRLILDTLELDYGHREHPDMNNLITVEHIMPQHLTDEWRAMLGPNATEVHPRLLHTPGNLTLTAYNSELGDKPFAEKKSLLSESNFSLTQSVLECDVWNEDAIMARGEELAKRAIEIWPR